MNRLMPRVPAGAPAQLGEHKMHDVLRQIVFAAGDEYLGAGDAVGAVARILRPGANDAEVGAGLGFGQVHRPGPFPGVEFRQVQPLLRFAAVGVDADRGSRRQRPIQEEAGICAPEHLFEQAPQEFGHALSAIAGIARNAEPTAPGQLLVSGLEPLGRSYRPIFPTAALAVACLVQRSHDFTRDPATFADDGTHQIIGELGELRNVAPFILHLEQIEQQEFQIPLWRTVFQHVLFLGGGFQSPDISPRGEN